MAIPARPGDSDLLDTRASSGGEGKKEKETNQYQGVSVEDHVKIFIAWQTLELRLLLVVLLGGRAAGAVVLGGAAPGGRPLSLCWPPLGKLPRGRRESPAC